MRRLTLLLVWALLAPLASAQQPVRLDTLSFRQVGPGMVHVQIHAPLVPWRIDVLELDLTSPYLEVQAVKSNDRRTGGIEGTTSMAARTDAPGRRVAGAINGDFYGGGGEANSVHVGSGQVVRRELSSFPSVGFDAANRPFISRPSVGGSVRTPSGSSVVISGYNEARGAHQLVLYNRYRGITTGTDGSGAEVLVRPLGPWLVNDTVRVVVEAIEVGTGGMAIPDGWAVLSASGTAATSLRAGLQVGDILRVYQRVSPGLPRVEDVISGNPILVLNGGPAPLDQGAFNVDRHPRTAVGFNADTTRLYLVTVDGRQVVSAGMSNFELRDFFLRIGAAHAINLDGGGSTTMVVRGDIVNVPSGGTERPVANALLAVSTAPEGPLAALQTTPSHPRPFLGQTVRFTVHGADAHYHPVPIDPSRVSFSVDPALGTISPEGVFTAGTSGGSGYVYTTYEGLRDSARVEVRTVERLEISPRSATTDTAQPVRFALRAFDTVGIERALQEGWVSWSVSDTTVGTVDATGTFRPRADGTALVVARFEGGAADTATVHVVTQAGTVVLDPLDAPEGWRLSSEGLVDEAATSLTAFEDPEASGGQSLRLRYAFTESAGASSAVYLHTDLAIPAVPDSINFHIRSDGANHLVRLLLEDHTGREFVISVPRHANDATALTLMPGPLARAPSDIVFPVRLQAIRIQFGYKDGRVTGARYEGDLWLDHLYVTYPARGTSSETGAVAPPGRVLLGNHPNPFRGSTTVTFQTDRAGPVRLALYDVLGRRHGVVFERAVGPGEHAFVLEAGGLPSGTYILRDEGGGARPLRLLVLR
jgi:hypothetical protein